MKRPPLPDMTVEQLVQVFADVSSAAGEAIDACRTAKANRLILRRFAICDELKRRPEPGVAALAALFGNPNAWVRYDAANALLQIMPLTARPVIQTIVDAQDFPIAGHAGMTLSFFDGDLRDLSPRWQKD